MVESGLISKLMSVAQGDAVALKDLASVPHGRLLEAWDESTRPAITRPAVLKVLLDLRDGRISQAEAGDWGKFVFYGHLPYVEYPHMPLDIDYDEVDDEIATAIMELEWIGDEIDGQLVGEHLESLIGRLREFHN
jgi:hypothetical protein